MLSVVTIAACADGSAPGPASPGTGGAAGAAGGKVGPDVGGRGGGVVPDAGPSHDAMMVPDVAPFDAPTPAPDAMSDALAPDIRSDGAMLVISPTEVSFPETRMYTMSPPQMFLVTNRGRGPTGQLTVGLTGERHFMVRASTCGPALAPDGWCTIRADFGPQEEGRHMTRLRVIAHPGGTVEASLTGSTPTTPSFRFTPDSVGFMPTSMAPSASPRTITVAITNVTARTTGALAMNLVSDGGDFTKAADGCSTTTLAPDASCEVTVRFKPLSAGFRRGTLEIVDAANDARRSAAVTGQALDGPYLSNLGYLPRMPDTPVGQSVVRMRTVANIGPGATGPINFDLSGDTSQFTLDRGTCAMPLLAANGDTPSTCTFRLTFAPTIVRENSLQIGVAANPGSGFRLGMTAKAVPMGASRLTTEVVPDPPFTNVAVGTSAIAVVRVRNAGASDAGKVTVRESGVHAADYVADDSGCGATLPPGGVCAIQVRFTPKAAGTRTVDLLLSAPNGYAPEVPFAGTAVMRSP